MRVLVKFDNSAKPQPIAGTLATSCGADSAHSTIFFNDNVSPSGFWV